MKLKIRKEQHLFFKPVLSEYTCLFTTVQSRERVRVPYSSTGTLSSVHISGTISTLIGSSTALF
ncbi:hypothetical protein GBAR_LOCUS14355, partial [Geodia barretti]